jgi:hypothetical protein
MAKRTVKYPLDDGMVFAQKMETRLDNGDVLVDIQVDAANAIATCTFDGRDGSETIPPTKPAFNYVATNGVLLAQKMWMHTDIGNKLYWLVVHLADGSVDCWFE